MGQMDGGWINGHKHGQINEYMCRWLDEWICRKMSAQIMDE
jgi:hypothetical protein